MQLDSHQHFWHYNPLEHGWMTEDMGALKRDFLPTDVQPLLAASGFDGCVAVQARQSLEETQWLLDLADEYDFIRGVVGWVDLCSHKLPYQLESFSSSSKFVGVRHVLQDEPDDRFMLREDFLLGIAHLEEFSLAYDLLIYPRHLPVATELVRQFPRQNFVVDHLAKPNIAACAISPWREDLQAIAEYPNVYCKLSGMVTEAGWKAWKQDDFRPFLDTAFEAFGPNRLMIGSDWPVCTVSADYLSTIGIGTSFLQQTSPDTQARILGENCAQFYGIPNGPQSSETETK